MYNPLFNEEEHRIRAGWRILIQFILMYGCTVLFILPLFAAGWNEPVSAFSLTGIVPQALGTVASVWIAGHYFDFRPFRDFGQQVNRQNLRELGRGLLLGLTGIASVFLVEWLSGWVRVTGFGWERIAAGQWSGMMAGFLLTMVLVGYYEELMYRGYQVINLAEGADLPDKPRMAVLPAVVLSSLLFGLMHAWNPNATLLSTVNITIAGAVFAGTFVLTGRLGYAVGMHIGWNFAQGGLFGFPVSGVPFRASLLQTVQSGPTTVTGGAFGPEGGIMGFLGLAVMAVLFALWFRFPDGWSSSLPLFSFNRQ